MLYPSGFPLSLASWSLSVDHPQYRVTLAWGLCAAKVTLEGSTAEGWRPEVPLLEQGSQRWHSCPSSSLYFSFLCASLTHSANISVFPWIKHLLKLWELNHEHNFLPLKTQHSWKKRYTVSKHNAQVSQE